MLYVFVADDENEIKVKRCPKCNTRLSSTPRYTDYVKAAMKDIINIKSKFYGLQRENEAKREELQRELITQYNNCLHIFPCNISIFTLLTKITLVAAKIHSNEKEELQFLQKS